MDDLLHALGMLIDILLEPFVKVTPKRKWLIGLALFFAGILVVIAVSGLFLYIKRTLF